MEKEQKVGLFEVALIMAIPALLIGLFELLLVTLSIEQGMGVVETSVAMYSKYGIVMQYMYIIVLLPILPIALVLYKKYGISFKDQIFSKKGKLKDVLFGVMAAITSFMFQYIILHVIIGAPINKLNDTSIFILSFISIVLVSGFCKEIYFRGLPFVFLKEHLGEWGSFLLGNICFIVLDWQNLGLSFCFGLIWYMYYRKRGALIIPIIGHGGLNLLSLLARAGAFSFLGIIPQ